MTPEMKQARGGSAGPERDPPCAPGLYGLARAWIGRMRWQYRYARLAVRSPYEITFMEAWREASGSWEMNQQERGEDPMPTPGEAIYEDQFEWRDR